MILIKRVLSDMYFLGRKHIFCDKYGLYRLKDDRIKLKVYLELEKT